MKPAETTVHLVDDDAAIRHSVLFQLETAGYVARDHASAEAFLEALPGLSVGCVITDVRMPGLNGLELVHRLNDLGFQAPIIMMTGHGDIPLAVQAMKAGVVDFIEKPIDDAILLLAISSALSKAATPEQQQALERQRRSNFDSLTPREREVLAGIIADKPNKVMAYELGISQRTVEVHRAAVMTKTGASNMSNLIRMALSVGF
jgi:two-component system response regulator FixJ